MASIFNKSSLARLMYLQHAPCAAKQIRNQQQQLLSLLARSLPLNEMNEYHNQYAAMEL
jgi:hypothetical protein